MKTTTNTILIFAIIFTMIYCVALVNAWTPDAFCQNQANGSFSEYISCNQYFTNLTTPINIVNNITQQNNSTLNITTNVTYIITNNITKIETDQELINAQIKKEVLRQLTIKEIPDDFSQLITLTYVKDRYYLKTEIDDKNALQDKELTSLKTAFTTLATQLTTTTTTSSSNKEVDDLKQQLAAAQKTEPQQPLALYGLIALITLLAAGYFYQQNNKEKEALKKMAEQRPQYPQHFKEYEPKYPENGQNPPNKN